MPSIERLTITLPAEMAKSVKEAVESGDYASTSEVVREALRDWKVKQATRLHQAARKADLAQRRAAPAAGRTPPRSPSDIVRALIPNRARST